MQSFLERLSQALIQESRWKMYLEGIYNTLRISIVAVIAGTLIGLVVAVVKIYSKDSKNPVVLFFNAVFNVYTTVVRGTPVVVQLLILFTLTWMPNNITACMIGFSINSGAYVSEIFRGGINSIDKGQSEAGRSLGLNRNQTMGFIVIPQAIKNILPALFNEFIVLIKETSVAGYIGAMDITKVADSLRGRTYESLHLYIAAVIYLVFVTGLTIVQRRIEKRLGKSDRG